MFEVNKQDSRRPKCFVSATTPLNERGEPPQKRQKEFSSVFKHGCYHKLAIVLPDPNKEDQGRLLSTTKNRLQYARVRMKLSELIEGDFFNQYIKIGNIVMRSQGRPGIDHVYVLCEGKLRLEVDKPTYERIGLQGTVIPGLGRKHVKALYAIEINLRLPSMVRGRKEFDRVDAALKRGLDHTVTWLFYDLRAPCDWSGPISKYKPDIRTIEPTISVAKNSIVPSFMNRAQEIDEENMTELLEWTSLALHTSPRISADDTVDTYLSRYRVWDAREARDQVSNHLGKDLMTIEWRGLLHYSIISMILTDMLEQLQMDLIIASATMFGGHTITVLQHGESTSMWEYAD